MIKFLHSFICVNVYLCMVFYRRWYLSLSLGTATRGSQEAEDSGKGELLASPGLGRIKLQSRCASSDLQLSEGAVKFQEFTEHR